MADGAAFGDVSSWSLMMLETRTMPSMQPQAASRAEMDGFFRFRASFPAIFQGFAG